MILKIITAESAETAEKNQREEEKKGKEIGINSPYIPSLFISLLFSQVFLSGLCGEFSFPKNLTRQFWIPPSH
jgi:hypothetical protein